MDESLKQYIAMKRQGKETLPNPLFNGHLADGHFSPLGCEVWAQAVGHRLSLTLAWKRVEEESSNRLGREEFGVGPAAPEEGTLESDTRIRRRQSSRSAASVPEAQTGPRALASHEGEVRERSGAGAV